MRKRAAVVGLCLAIVPAAAFAAPPFKTTPSAGTRHYRYTAVERNPNQPEGRYRVDFDLVTDAKGGVIAVIRKAEQGRGESWTTPTVSAECKAALHGNGETLARIRLAPLSVAAADSLGEPFMAMCAPPSYFFPMTDILNVVLIQTSPVFHINDLTDVGKGVRFDGFKTKLDRLGTGIAAASPGGTITLAALDEHAATVDWAPDPMQLTLTVHANGNTPEMTMAGTERYAFRAEIDRQTGALRRAVTTSDDLDLVVNVPNAPADKLPHVAVSREVAIESRE
jgi:hypothetical protein